MRLSVLLSLLLLLAAGCAEDAPPEAFLSLPAADAVDRVDPLTGAQLSHTVVGKLPHTTVRVSYELEYGTDSLEMHSDAVDKDQKVLIVDDLLATGGTARATVDLVRKLGGDVHGVAVLIELVALKGRGKLAGENVRAVLEY